MNQKQLHGNRVKLGVVGTGNWGQNLVRVFASSATADMVYICDTNEQVRKKMSLLYPNFTVTDRFDSLLNDGSLNAIAIALESPLHFEFAKKALEAGKHTYVEKPMTLTSRDARELVELAKKQKCILMVGHLMEYHPAVNYMKSLLKKGTVGQPLYLYCQRLNLGIVRKTENAWWSLAPHDISVACCLFEAEPVSVSLNGQCYLRPGIEDVVFGCLKFTDGRMAHIHVSWLDPHKVRKVTLVGSEKMVVFDDMEASEKIRIYDKGAEIKTVNSYVEAITLRTGDILIPKIQSQEPLGLECQHFLDAILAGAPVCTDGNNGCRVVKVLEAGSRSLREGGKAIEL